MKRYTVLLLAVLCGCMPLMAQKVGLVLSGGGAKGLTHIGVIRALEENNIPIDYVAGTSMGAIVGSLYAMGYSPDEMEAMIKSDDFKRWYSGGIEERYMYYFKTNPSTPEFINIRVSLKKGLKQGQKKAFRPIFLPSSVVDPIQMNIVFLNLYAQATAACRADFDSLFIPFRCVASDIYNKCPLIMKNGDLGDAVRASMSFPMMFKPIEIDSILVYDGGIYDNFPVNVMRKDFKPDIIIGSVVSSNPGKPKEGDVMSQLENMVMQKTDYTIPDSLGILLSFKYEDVNLMDFQKYDRLHEIGYKRTMALMDSIKGRISRRMDQKLLRAYREKYKKGMPQFRFRNIEITGANNQQSRYIRKEFHESSDKIFTMEDVKRAYFRLLSDNSISEIIPHAVYNPADSTFDLKLNVTMTPNLSLRIGGNLGTNKSNQVYFGATYQDLNYYSKEFSIDGQAGRAYNSLQLGARIDFATKLPTSYRMIASISTFDYYKDGRLFSDNDNPAFNKKKEEFARLTASLPFLSNKKAEFGFSLGHLEDKYFQTSVIDLKKDRHDRSSYLLLGGSIALEGSTLDSRQYPTSGSKERLTAQIYTGSEKFKPGTVDEANSVEYEASKQSWIQFSYELEKYLKLKNKFNLGTYVKLYYSSRNFSENYMATLMQAGEFSPTPHSKITYNEAFRANQYVALGAIPIYELNNTFHFRGEIYAFAPIFPIKRGIDNKAYYGKVFSKYEFMGELSLVCKLSFGSICAYVNHYSSLANDWNVGLSIGWQLFNSRFFE